MTTGVVVVLVTVPTDAEARRLARTMVEERLAACVNVLGPVRSVYRWEGAVQEDEERLLVMKARQRDVATLAARVRALHSYTVPEVVALPVVAGSIPYLTWVRAETARPPRRRRRARRSGT